MLGTEPTTPPGNNGWFKSSPTLRCPAAPSDLVDQWWSPVRYTYQANPRLMPVAYEITPQGGVATDPVSKRGFSRRALSSVKNGAEKILVWDASVCLDGKEVSIWYSTYMERFVIQWGHSYCEPGWANPSQDLDVVAAGGYQGVKASTSVPT